MSIRIMTAVWDMHLPDSDKIVLLALADNANDEGVCWPSIATIARKCSKDERTVQRVIGRLKDAGHVSTIERPGTSNLWTIHPRHDDTPGKMPPRHDAAQPPVTMPPKPSGTPKSQKATPSSTGAREASVFPKPDGVDGDVWSDFLANRKRKRLPNTATAHRKLLADLDRLVDDQWPPGRILEAVTAKGWGAIYASIKDGDGRNGSDRNSGNGADREGDGFTRALRRASAKLEADELGGGQGDFGMG